MAKKTSTTIVRAVPVRTPTPIIRVQAPRVHTSGKKKTKHRRRAGSGALTVQRLIEFAIGGAVLGFAEKQFPNLPNVPMLGRKGTITALAYWMSDKGKKPGLIRDVALAGAVLSGYDLGSTGAIHGDIAPQVGRVHGVAAQV